MNLRHITLALLGLTWMFSSCNSDTEYDISLASKDAQISSFSLTGLHDKTLDSLDRAEDSIRFVVLGKTKFAIDQVGGLIYNPDSLPYGFKLKTLLPAISYKDSPSSMTFVLKESLEANKDTTIQWASSDSVNFAYKSISLEVIPATYNESDKKIYKLDLRIHKIDPDLLSWKLVGRYSKYAENRKSVSGDACIYTLTRTLDTELILEEVQEIDGLATVDTKSVIGLPENVKIESFNKINNSFYVVDENGSIYESSDALQWIEKKNDKNILEIIGIAPGNKDADSRTIVLLNKDGRIYFGETVDFSEIKELYPIPSNFPVEGFSSIVNMDTKNNARKVLLVGAGKNANDDDLSSIWLLRMDDGILTSTLSGSSSLFSGSGNSIFLYDDKLYMYAKRELYISSDWGKLWRKAPDKQALPSTIQSYTDQSVIVKGNKIWILGGKEEDSYSSVGIWTGVLNRLR